MGETDNSETDNSETAMRKRTWGKQIIVKRPWGKLTIGKQIIVKRPCSPETVKHLCAMEPASPLPEKGPPPPPLQIQSAIRCDRPRGDDLSDVGPDHIHGLVPDLAPDLVPDLVPYLVQDLATYCAIHFYHLSICDLTWS